MSWVYFMVGVFLGAAIGWVLCALLTRAEVNDHLQTLTDALEYEEPVEYPGLRVMR